jgi:hypothetical protein
MGMGMDTGMGMDMDMDMGFVRDSDYYVDLERNGTAIVCIVTHVPLPNPEPDRLSPPLRYLFTIYWMVSSSLSIGRKSAILTYLPTRPTTR